jgi:hypothetical protein
VIEIYLLIRIKIAREPVKKITEEIRTLITLNVKAYCQELVEFVIGAMTVPVGKLLFNSLT